VLDFSWALVGSITTKTLGDLGAEVIKLESRTRPCLSRLDVQVGVSRAGNLDDKPWFSHLNTSKLSLSLDLKQPASRELLEPLLDWADVVVENFSPGTLEKLGLDYPRLAARNPGLIMVSGSVYGQTGPLARSWGVDGTGAALSGRTYLTGWPDRDPVIPSAAPYGDVILPYAMAAAVIAALEHRVSHQRGCHIDASMYELCVQQMRDAFLPGASATRPGNSDPRVFHQGVYATRDAERWIAITFHTQQQWQAFARSERLAAADAGTRASALAAWCATRPGGESVEYLQHEGIAAGEVQGHVGPGRAGSADPRAGLVAQSFAPVARRIRTHAHTLSTSRVPAPTRSARPASANTTCVSLARSAGCRSCVSPSSNDWECSNDRTAQPQGPGLHGRRRPLTSGSSSPISGAA
jgi:crotonobetainyl-CoA:carnitine CoA-transferase CaiB-like acyl-CoA transferase